MQPGNQNPCQAAPATRRHPTGPKLLRLKPQVRGYEHPLMGPDLRFFEGRPPDPWTVRNISLLPKKRKPKGADVTTKTKAPLRVATDADLPPAPKPKPESLKAAADLSERELLVAMRDKISDAIAAGVPSHTLAPLMRQLREIDKEIRGLDARARQEGTPNSVPVDDTFDASAV